MLDEPIRRYCATCFNFDISIETLYNSYQRQQFIDPK
jgi:hypothetical protein